MTGKITILFITHYAGMYGANQSMCQLMADLKDNYNVAPVVLIPQEGKICEFLKSNHIDYIVYRFFWWVNADRSFFKLFLNIRKQIRNHWRLSTIIKMLHGRKIDLVYSNSIVVNFGYFLSRNLNVPHIWHLRETLQAYNFRFSLGGYLSKKILDKGADQYIAISDFVSNAYTPYIPKNKIVTVHNGVNHRIGAKRVVNMLHGTLNICCVGIICEQKNQLDILKAVTILYRRGIVGIKVHFVGDATSGYLSLVKNFIESNALEELVEFHGFRSDLDHFLNSMNIGIMPSRDEGFGRVSIEYMLHRMPVIASKSGANAELIQEGVNGLLYSIYHPDQLADRIEYFIDHPPALDTMGSTACEYASQNFSLEMNTRAIYGVMENALKLPPVPSIR